MKNESRMGKTEKIAIALGGNLGDTVLIFDRAVEKLRAGGVAGIVRSGLYRTRAVDCVPGTPDFVNAALTGEWGGAPLELLALTQAIERSEGRPEEHSSREARTLDLDIILFGDGMFRLPGLEIPHPRALSRRFVLEPLAEVAGGWIFPGTDRRILDCLSGCG